MPAANTAAMQPIKSRMHVFMSAPCEHWRALFAERGFAFPAIFGRVVQFRPARFELSRRQRRIPVLRAHGLLDGAKSDRCARGHAGRESRDFSIEIFIGDDAG